MRLVSLILLVPFLATAQPAGTVPVSSSVLTKIQKLVEARRKADKPTAADADREAVDEALAQLTDERFTLLETRSLIDQDPLHTALRKGFDNLFRRADQQTGESSAGGGTTSLVARSGVTELFSAAFENGALARDKQGTITTFRFGGYGIYAFLTGKDRPCGIVNPACDSTRELALRGLSGSVSIDNNPGTSGTTTANTAANFTPSPILNLVNGGGRFSSASVRYQFLSRKIPKTDGEVTSFRAAVDKTKAARQDHVKAIEKLLNGEDTPPAVRAALDRFKTNIVAAGRGPLPQGDPAAVRALAETYARELATLQRDMLSPSFTEFVDASRKAERALARELSALLLKPKATIEYVHNSPLGQASTSNLRGIIDMKLWKKNRAGGEQNDDYDGLLTFNGGFTLYESVPEGLKTGRWRDAQFAGQIERKLGPARWNALRPVAAFAGYYQYQAANAILTFDQNPVTPNAPIPIAKPAAEVLDTKGHIGIVQGKLTIKVTESISVPIAVSWANRTELIAKPKSGIVKGQFGISLDLDKIRSLLGGG